MRDAAAAAAVELGSTCLESGSKPVQTQNDTVSTSIESCSKPVQTRNDAGTNDQEILFRNVSVIWVSD